VSDLISLDGAGIITNSTGTYTIGHVSIHGPWQEAEDRVKVLEEELQRLREDIAEAFLFGDYERLAVSVYEMDHDAYLELPGNIRL
jgi:hypothetical protein